MPEGGAFEHVVTGGEHSAESADVEEFATEPVFGGLGFLRIGSIFWEAFDGCFDTLLLLGLDHGTLLDEDVVAVGGVAHAGGWEKVEEIADFAFEANVGNETAIGVGIETRHVASIGVAVGVAIGDFEEEEEIVTVGEDI